MLGQPVLHSLNAIASILIPHGSTSTPLSLTSIASISIRRAPTSIASTSITHSFDSFVEAAGQFFSDLAAVHWGALVLGLAFFGLNLTLRSRAFFHSLRAAYPAVSFQWRRIWGAYLAAVGFNNVVPARGGDIIKLFLTRSSIPGSSYPTVASAFFVESIFDAGVGVVVLVFAFSQGVFPKPPDFSKLNSFDISYLAEHFRFTLFLITLLAILGLVAFALLSVRIKAFWARVRQGLTILTDRRRYLREVVAWQAAAWACRFVAFWFLLDAFRVGGSAGNVLLAFGAGQVAGAVPFTPGGAGVQQALLVKVFAASAPTAVVAAYSVGQQIAIAMFTAIAGLAAVVLIFRFRSFKEVIAAGRASREAERQSEGAGEEPATAVPRAPRARV
ncbi:MAG TPA: lysylphosphatidylglycerol synthase transmembrane domain-containing protein [Solirubrobacteraceae bacterium]|nr:lysylphosphatidylglycerol synthase transmembrane domain-containing protein [Solirubrobacteraceae bacterium]